MVIITTRQQVDPRADTEVKKWVDSILPRYNDRVKTMKEENPACQLESMNDEELDKNGKKLLDVVRKEIVRILEPLTLENFFFWKWEDEKNPLLHDPSTETFAQAGFGKNLFLETAKMYLSAKQQQAIDVFLESYIGQGEEEEEDLEPEIRKMLEEARLTKTHELKLFLSALLAKVNRPVANDPAEDEEALEGGMVAPEPAPAMDLTLEPVWRDSYLEQMLRKYQKEDKKDASDPKSISVERIAKEAKKFDIGLVKDMSEWKQLVWGFVDEQMMLEKKKEDEVPDQNKNSQLWKDVVSSFFDEDDIKMIVSKMMLEGDPSINREDQDREGWEKVGKISCEEFNRLIQGMPDFERRFTMDEV